MSKDLYVETIVGAIKRHNANSLENESLPDPLHRSSQQFRRSNGGCGSSAQVPESRSHWSRFMRRLTVRRHLDFQNRICQSQRKRLAHYTSFRRRAKLYARTHDFTLIQSDQAWASFVYQRRGKEGNHQEETGYRALFNLKHQRTSYSKLWRASSAGVAGGWESDCSFCRFETHSLKTRLSGLELDGQCGRERYTRFNWIFPGIHTFLSIIPSLMGDCNKRYWCDFCWGCWEKYP